MADKHVADGEAKFLVLNVSPDFCKVGRTIVPFEIFQLLPPEKSDFSPDVLSRGEKTLKVGSAVAGVIGNLGEGVMSTVSDKDGHTVMIEGEGTVLVNGSPVVRHLDLCEMNFKL